jgi:hypothetical protein
MLILDREQVLAVAEVARLAAGAHVPLVAVGRKALSLIRGIHKKSARTKRVIHIAAVVGFAAYVTVPDRVALTNALGAGFAVVFAFWGFAEIVAVHPAALCAVFCALALPVNRVIEETIAAEVLIEAGAFRPRCRGLVLPLVLLLEPSR